MGEGADFDPLWWSDFGKLIVWSSLYVILPNKTINRFIGIHYGPNLKLTGLYMQRVFEVLIYQLEVEINTRFTTNI